MTRRRFYAPPAAFADGSLSVTLDAAELRHLRDVLRLKAGEEVFVFDGLGNEFRCQVTDATAQSGELSVIDPVQPARRESPLALSLAVALLKGEKFDLVVQKAAELGVVRILPVLTARSDVRIPDPKQAGKRLERWNRLAMEAAKQSGRAFVPVCDPPAEFSTMVADTHAGAARIMFTERGGLEFGQAVDSWPAAEGAIALIGPEGGWSDDELELARANGWALITLGGRTLRAETAAIAVAAILQHRLGDLN